MSCCRVIFGVVSEITPPLFASAVTNLTYFAISGLVIVPLSCQKSVKCQHLWQKATSSRLLCSAVSSGILAQVLLALPLFVIVCSGRRPRASARTQHSSKTHLRQHHDGGGDGGEGGTSVGVSDVRTHSLLNPHSLHVAVGV